MPYESPLTPFIDKSQGAELVDLYYYGGRGCTPGYRVGDALTMDRAKAFSRNTGGVYSQWLAVPAGSPKPEYFTDGKMFVTESDVRYASTRVQIALSFA